MVLLVGSNKDKVLKYFAEFLVHNRVPIIFLNQNKIYDTVLIANQHLLIDSIEYHYYSFSGVLNRVVDVSRNEAFKGLSKGLSLLSCVINTKLKNVINKVQYCAPNDSKLNQITTLTRKFIKIPNSQILAKISLARLAKRRYIFKSLSSIRSIVTEYKPQTHKISLTHEPVLFQQLLLGKNVRVHVINNKCFATLIKTSKIDYRYDYDNREFFDYELPDEIKEECVLIARNLSLIFCGIDLIECDSSYYLLEVNPSPGYSFYEKNLPHQEISKALMNTLIGSY